MQHRVALGEPGLLVEEGLEIGYANRPGDVIELIAEPRAHGITDLPAPFLNVVVLEIEQADPVRRHDHVAELDIPVAVAHARHLIEARIEEGPDAVVSFTGFRRQIAAVKGGLHNQVGLILIGGHVAPVALVDVTKIAVEGGVKILGQRHDAQGVGHAGPVFEHGVGDEGHQPELLAVELDEGVAFDRQVKIRREKITGKQGVSDVAGKPELIEVLLPPDPLQHQPPGLGLDAVIGIDVAERTRIYRKHGLENLVAFEKRVDLVVAEFELVRHGPLVPHCSAQQVLHLGAFVQPRFRCAVPLVRVGRNR